VARRTPIVILTGYLGSGKTTLLRRLVALSEQRLAIVMNEFGELSVDARVVAGRNIKIAELEGGCVCCSLAGEFEAAIKEIVETVGPEEIIVETTGLAEPDALIGDIQENLPDFPLDAVVTLVDADATVRFPSIGQTGRIQIEMADLILLNKIDLVTDEQRRRAREIVRGINPAALLLETIRGEVDPALILGRPLRREPEGGKRREAPHSPSMESFQLHLNQTFDRSCFEKVIGRFPPQVYRAKGFVRFPEGVFLFNFVAGRSELTPFPEEGPLGVVFIGEKMLPLQAVIEAQIAACAIPVDPSSSRP